MAITDKSKNETTNPAMQYDALLSAGLCDKCSVPKMVNSGNGIDEPLNPYMWCDDVCWVVEPLPEKEQIEHCQFFKPCT
jgi:hypothetical protein